jgi:D-alanine-D-alanine ligase
MSLLHTQRHPLLSETSERAKETTVFYAGIVDYEVRSFEKRDEIPNVSEWISA